MIGRVRELAGQLHKGQVKGSLRVSIQTLDALYKVVRASTASSVSQMMKEVRAAGESLAAAAPQEITIGNMVRRVLYIIQYENTAAERKSETISLSLSLSNLLDYEAGEAATTRPVSEIQSNILSELDELINELDTVHAHIAEHAIEQIHAEEVILTFGRSQTILEFLLEAAKLRSFQVVIAESAPSYSGQDMAMELAKHHVDTIVIPDSAVFAIMSRVNKVLLGAHAVLHNGGIIGHTGVYNIAASAQYHCVPLVVVTGLYKLTPSFAFDQDTFNEQNAPSQITTFEEGCPTELEIENPAFDYVPPEYVSLFVTNAGEHSPSYIYRLLSEYYRADDMVL